MSKSQFDLNKEIENFLIQRDKSKPVTKDELAYLNQYAGFGGMWKFDKNLPEERGFYEYYTPFPVIEKMVGLAYKYGYAGGKVNEPSCGTGNFLHYFSPDTQLTAYEPDFVSYEIARLNFPTFDIQQRTFNSIFVDRKGNAQSFTADYSLVIGNPPYGAFAGKGTTAEKNTTSAQTYPEYFITRSIDLLLPGGLLVFIVPSGYVDGAENKVKTQIDDKADLLDAYRLPKKIFSETDIQTDIVVYRKK